jgi:hypothetical protein
MEKCLLENKAVSTGNGLTIRMRVIKLKKPFGGIIAKSEISFNTSIKQILRNVDNVYISTRKEISTECYCIPYMNQKFFEQFTVRWKC